MDHLPLIVALAVVMVGIAALGVLVSRGERSRLALSRGLDEVTGRLKAVADSQALQTKTIEERLEAVSGRMGVSLKDSATETARSVGALGDPTVGHRQGAEEHHRALRKNARPARHTGEQTSAGALSGRFSS